MVYYICMANTVSELDAIWSREAESYQAVAAKSPDYLAHFEVVAEALKPVRGKKILDVGSGTAITSGYLAGMGGRMYLVDISQKALEFGKKYFRAKKLAGKFFKQDAFEMKFAKESFDGVWNGGVIEHFDDNKKIEMMKIMWNLVKPGGVLLITCPNYLDLPFMLAKQILIWRNKWTFGWEDDLTHSRLAELAIKSGITTFEIFAYNPIVGWWFFPFGKEMTQKLGLNTKHLHKAKSVFGHNLVFRAIKPKS
jgi:2-polyprenyl-3-methyl-5-hydroxy-6-metoxy-1,4-benzoquinol methylase